MVGFDPLLLYAFGRFVLLPYSYYVVVVREALVGLESIAYHVVATRSAHIIIGEENRQQDKTWIYSTPLDNRTRS